MTSKLSDEETFIDDDSFDEELGIDITDDHSDGREEDLEIDYDTDSNSNDDMNKCKIRS